MGGWVAWLVGWLLGWSVLMDEIGLDWIGLIGWLVVLFSFVFVFMCFVLYCLFVCLFVCLRLHFSLSAGFASCFPSAGQDVEMQP